MTISERSPQTTVAVLVGSLRTDSVNRRIAERLRESAPVDVTVEIVEGLGELPFYNEEIDGDFAPASVQALRERVAAADRVLAVTPEHNGTMPPVLGNAIDWLSRPYGAGAIVGKPFAVVGATPTPYGGKWAHEAARRSAGIAGAVVVADIAVSQSTIEADVIGDSLSRPPATALPSGSWSECGDDARGRQGVENGLGQDRVTRGVEVVSVVEQRRGGVE